MSNNDQSNKTLYAAQDFYIKADNFKLEKNFKKAIENYKACLQLQPNHAAANYFCAKTYNQISLGVEALPFAKKAVSLQPTNNHYRSALAESYALSGAFDMAILEYKKLATAQPTLAEINLFKAAFYATYNKNYDEAIRIYQTIEKQYGYSEDVAFKKIGVYKNQKQYNAMLNEYDQLIALDPTELNYKILKLEVYELNKDSIGYEKAVDILESEHADDPRIIPTIVLNLLVKGDTVKYKSELKKAMDNASITPEDKVNMLMPVITSVEKDSTNLPSLIAYCKQILSSAPNDTKAIGIYASVLASAGKTKEAAEQYQHLIKKDPSKLENWQQLIGLYASDNNFDSVLTTAQNAKNIFPNQSYFHMMQGIAHQQLENFGQAVKAYNKALDYVGKSKEDKLNIYTQLGDTYNSLKEYQKSDSCYELALKIDDQNETTLNNYAYFLSLRKENLEKAAKMSRLSLIIRPLEKTFLDTYAWILFQQGKFEEALVQMELAITDEADATLWEHYGDILSKLSRQEEAVSNWKKAKQKGSKSPTLDKKISTKNYYE